MEHPEACPGADRATPRSDLRVSAARSSLPLLFIVLAGVSAYRVLAWMAADIDLFSDESYYWSWAQELAWGYYSKPPMVAWLIALATRVLGSSELAVKAPAIALVPLAALGLHRLGRRLFDDNTGFNAALLYFLMPGMFMLGIIVTTDVPLLLFWTLALYLWWRALHENRWSIWCALGLSCGLGLLSKYTMLMFGAAAALQLCFDPGLRRHWRNLRLYVAAGIAAACLLPNLLWNARQGWPTLRHTADISHLDRTLWHPAAALEFIAAQLGVFGPLSLVLLLALALGPLRSRLPPRQGLMLRCFTLLPLAAMFTQALLARAFGNWAAVAYVAGSVWLAAELASRSGERLLRWAVGANVALALLFYHHQPVLHLFGHADEYRYDAFARVRGWQALGAELRSVIDMQPEPVRLLGDERSLLAQMQYYAGLEQDQLLSWHPPLRRADSQYDLQRPLREGEERPLLLMIDARRAEHLARHFREAQRLPDLVSEPYPGLQRRYALWRVRGFVGYEGGTASP